MTDPIHCAQSQSRGVEIYSGAECIARATTKQEAYNLALAVLMGPQKVGQVLVKHERIRMHIARCALTFVLEGQ